MRDDYEIEEISGRPRMGERPRSEPATLAGASPSVYVASLACLALIVGGVGPWATTAFGLMSVSGTSLHGGQEVAVGIVGLAMLGMHLWRGARLPLIVASVAGALGAIQAVMTFGKIRSNGAITLFGVQYRYLDPAWGLYLVLAAAIALACAAGLAWRTTRVAG